jgi:hypothetical protein
MVVAINKWWLIPTHLLILRLPRPRHPPTPSPPYDVEMLTPSCLRLNDFSSFSYYQVLLSNKTFLLFFTKSTKNTYHRIYPGKDWEVCYNVCRRCCPHLHPHRPFWFPKAVISQTCSHWWRSCFGWTWRLQCPTLEGLHTYLKDIARLLCGRNQNNFPSTWWRDHIFPEKENYTFRRSSGKSRKQLSVNGDSYFSHKISVDYRGIAVNYRKK